MSVAARALHGINVCLIPSPYNNDRPLVLRHRPLAAVSAALLAIKALAAITLILTPTPAQLSTITVNRIIQLTNAERTKAGLKPLTVNSALTAAAQDKGNNMLAYDYFAHISPTGVTPWFWITKHGYNYLVAGENLAIDFTEAEDVVAAWMASPSHRANILQNEYTEMGVAVVTGEFQGGTSTIVVHMFGLPAGSPSPTPTPATAGTHVTATPVPTLLATPTPTPIPPTPQSTPNASPLPAPRIALIGSSIVQNSTTLSVTGIPGTTVTVLINGQVRVSKTIESLPDQVDIDLNNEPDGELALRAYAGNSQLSEPVVVTKDTSGPPLAIDQLPFVLMPAFDAAQAVVALPASGSERLAFIETTSPQTIQVADEVGNITKAEILLAPHFDPTLTPQELAAPQRIVQLSRQITAVTLVILLALLSLAIFIRVRIQHPSLITHASLAIMLAAVLFLV